MLREGGELRIDKGRDRFDFLDQRTDDQILSVRRELVDNLESESAFYKRQCLICARDIHDRLEFYIRLLARLRGHRAERNVAPEQDHAFTDQVGQRDRACSEWSCQASGCARQCVRTEQA